MDILAQSPHDTNTGSSPHIPQHAVITGAGGMGKTAVATAVLHHKKMVTTFGARHYFIACESLDTFSMLAYTILQAVRGGAHQHRQDAIAAMKQCLAGAAPALLILDNFETVYYTGKITKREQDSALGDLCLIPGIHVLITM